LAKEIGRRAITQKTVLMYIEFRLPMGAGGAAAGAALAQIRKDLDTWATRYQIAAYRTKIHKYTYRLSFDNNKDYTQFALTWNPRYTVSNNFVLINPK